jgi:hypothetical protein
VIRFNIQKLSFVRERLEEFMSRDESNKSNRFAVELMADCDKSDGNKEKTRECYEHLVTIDPIRSNFWKWKI